MSAVNPAPGRDCKHGHLARKCEICDLETTNAELRADIDTTIRRLVIDEVELIDELRTTAADLAQLRKLIEGRGFTVVDGEFLLSDGTRSRLGLTPTDSMKIMKAAMNAREYEIKFRENNQS